MDMAFTPEDRAFRDEVRDFLAGELSLRICEKERLGIALTRDEYVEWHRILARPQAGLVRLRTIASEENDDGGRCLIEDTTFRRKIAEIEIELKTLETTGLRVLAALSADREDGPEASLLEIRGTEVEQRISELMSEAVVYCRHPYVPEPLKHGWTEEPIGPEYATTVNPFHFSWRKASISGGSSEIQRDIMAKRALGL